VPTCRFRRTNLFIVISYTEDSALILSSIPPSPAIFPSLVRLVATGGIFTFHYLGLFEQYSYRLDFFAILIFCFLSGYLANISKSTRSSWAIRRYFGIMIPYWLVIFSIIFANYISQYKVTSPTALVVTVLGGNMFLDDPLYVIAWYVTFVLILYGYAFVESFFDSWHVLICMVIGALLFSICLGKGYYFTAFIAGLRLSGLNFFTYPKMISKKRCQLANCLFILQRYCYSFYLIHGAVLLILVKRTNLTSFSVFWLTLVISSILSVVLYSISKPVQKIVINRTQKLTEKMLVLFSTSKPFG